MEPAKRLIRFPSGLIATSKIPADGIGGIPRPTAAFPISKFSRTASSGVGESDEAPVPRHGRTGPSGGGQRIVAPACRSGRKRFSVPLNEPAARLPALLTNMTNGPSELIVGE